MSGKTMSPKMRKPTMWQTLLTKYIDLFNSIHGATRKAGDLNWLTHLMILFHPTITMVFCNRNGALGNFTTACSVPTVGRCYQSVRLLKLCVRWSCPHHHEQQNSIHCSTNVTTNNQPPMQQPTSNCILIQCQSQLQLKSMSSTVKDIT